MTPWKSRQSLLRGFDEVKQSESISAIKLMGLYIALFSTQYKLTSNSADPEITSTIQANSSADKQSNKKHKKGGRSSSDGREEKKLAKSCTVNK
jgi:hypothetical protein